MKTVDQSAAAWKRRHAKTRAERDEARRESNLLRTALDELNADVEGVLSDASQGGIESAKSSLIMSQRVTIRRMRARLREAGIDAKPVSS